jgi:hypothetical protein
MKELPSTPKDDEMYGDFWFILADNLLYGFEVNSLGESGTGSQNSVQMKFEIKVGTSDSLPISAAAYKGEVSLRLFRGCFNPYLDCDS